MKKLLSSLILCGFVALSFCTQAQNLPMFGQMSLGATGAAYAATNSTAGTAIEFPSVKDFTIYCTGKGTNAAATQTVTIRFAASPDGTNYTTTRAGWSVDMVLNGTTAVWVPAKIDGSGFKTFKQIGIENPGSASTQALTNVAVYYFAR